MDYLSRILNYVGGGDQDNFKFHYRCKEMKLSHLCFADGLLLFYNGDFSSIMCCSKGFRCYIMPRNWSLTNTIKRFIMLVCLTTKSEENLV